MFLNEKEVVRQKRSHPMKVNASCPNCQTSLEFEIEEGVSNKDVVCSNCGAEFTMQCSGQDCEWHEHGEPRATVLSAVYLKTNKPHIASMLLGVSGVLSVITALVYLVPGMPHLGPFLEFIYTMPLGQVAVGLVTLFGALCAFFAMFCCYMRQWYRYAVLSCALSVLGAGLFIGVVLSLIGLFLIVDAKGEFDDGEKNRFF